MNPLSWILAMSSGSALQYDARTTLVRCWHDLGVEVPDLLRRTPVLVTRDIHEFIECPPNRALAFASQMAVFLRELTDLAASNPSDEVIDQFAKDSGLNDEPRGAILVMHAWNEDPDPTKLSTGTDLNTGEPRNPVLFDIAVKKRLGITT